MKFLISRPDKIGDVVLALHGVKQLKRMLPQCEVYLHVADYTAQLVENIRFVDHILLHGESLREHEFDAVVDLMAKPNTAWSYWFSGIPVRIGNSARWFRSLYTRTRYIRRSHALMNEAEYNWQLVRLLHPDLKNSALVDSIQPGDFKEIVPFDHQHPFLAFMPGVSVSAEAWSLQKWEDLCRLARMRFPHLEALFLLGPAEREIEESLRARLHDCRGVVFRNFEKLNNVLGALQLAWGYVGPSTGITHLASAMRCAGVGLYPTAKSMHPKRWAPFLASLEILSPASRTDPRDVIESLARQLQPKPISIPSEKPFVSGFVICKNEEVNIRRCLESIRWCDEILIVDSGSTDKTLDIVREYHNTRIIERSWPGHREQKQFALEHCKGEWVLNLDADEELSLELRAEIQRILENAKDNPRKIADGYFLCRVVYFLNRWWDRGGWFPEYRMRFFRRETAYWGGVNPHEKAMVQGSRRKLRGHIYHYTSRGIGDYVDTLNRFSENSAHALFEAGVRSNPIRILLHPIFRFFKFYFLKRGFLEGTLGFIMASTEGFYTFLKYAKLWELGYIQKHGGVKRPNMYEGVHVEKKIPEEPKEEGGSEVSARQDRISL